MSQTCLHPGSRPASPALLSGKSRLGNLFLDARSCPLAGHVSRAGRLGSDGASLGFVSGLSIDPVAADVNLYRYCGNTPTNATDSFGLFADFHGCGEGQVADLKALEKMAQQEIATLQQQVTNALKTSTLDRITRFRLEQALKCLGKASNKLKTANVKCDNKEQGFYGKTNPWGVPDPRPGGVPGNTIVIGGIFWNLKGKAQAATLVHEATHMGCGTTDWTYFWQNGKPPSNRGLGGAIGFDIIASTYDSWILGGFFIPGVDNPPNAPPPASWNQPGKGGGTITIPPPELSVPDSSGRATTQTFRAVCGCCVG